MVSVGLNWFSFVVQGTQGMRCVLHACDEWATRVLEPPSVCAMPHMHARTQPTAFWQALGMYSAEREKDVAIQLLQQCPTPCPRECLVHGRAHVPCADVAGVPERSAARPQNRRKDLGGARYREYRTQQLASISAKVPQPYAAEMRMS